MNDLPEPAIDQPEQADPDAPGDRRRQVLAERPAGRPAQADEGPRQARRRDGDVAPRSRRANASTPMTRRTTATTATGSSDGQSNWPASGMWFAVQPNQVRFGQRRERRGSRPGSR